MMSRICGGPGVDDVGLITRDYAVVASCGNGGDDTFAITVSSKHQRQLGARAENR